MTYQSKFLNILQERGFIHQQTDESGLDAYLTEHEKNGASAVAYIGFDCTAESLHVGNLMAVMTLFWFQRCGHKPIILLGGGTTKIGDPSGKDESRKLLDEAAIQKNMEGIRKNFESFIDWDRAELVDNAEWIDSLLHINFLRDVARYFSVNKMLTKDSVSLRLERDSHLSLLEFLYMAHQAHDFTILAEKYDCRLQIGGSDQWGNITQGTELKRNLNAANGKAGKKLFGLTTPLITTASGAKMGKTADGAMWLNSDMLSPYDYWQFWRNTEDADVGRFLRFFTDLSLEEIAKLEALEGAEINEAKKQLANEATRLLHGEEAAALAAETAQKTFEQGTVGDDLPEFTVSEGELTEGIPAFKLWHLSGLASSGKEARRLISGGGARLNDVKVENEMQLITAEAIGSDGYAKLSAGKKKHAILRLA
jgi:tyrosyl-tRNA synthetase